MQLLLLSRSRRLSMRRRVAVSIRSNFSFFNFIVSYGR
nr:MAG TPA: hypothetical protein [Caudoviricetes sp.]